MKPWRAALAVIVVGAGLATAAAAITRLGDTPDGWCRDVTDEVGLEHRNPYGPVTAFEEMGAVMQRNMGNGAAVGDYDDDGDLDVYLLSNAGHPARLFRNDLESGELRFRDVTEEAGVSDDGLGRVAHLADLDGDRDLDLLVLNDHDGEGVLPPSRLFRNDGDGTFTDVSEKSGLQFVSFLIGGASLADYDRDGDLDVYVSVWTREIGASPVGTEPEGPWPGANALYENLGDLTFRDVTRQVGLEPLRLDTFTTVFHDFDGDRDLDLYVTVDHREDRFYEQVMPGRFADRSSEALVNHRGNDMGVAAGDATGDGSIELFVTNVFDPQQSFGVSPPGNTLLETEPRDGGGIRFRDQAEARGVLDVGWGWGTTFTDIDLDGDLDLFAVQGFDEFVGPDFELHDRSSVLFTNNGGGQFTPHPDDACAFAGDQRSLIAFDADRDHDPDYLITQVDRSPLLIENQASRGGGRGATVVLDAPAALAAGARVESTTSSGSVTQLVLAGGSYLAGPPLEAYLGLGDDHAATVSVTWADGSVTDIGEVAAGTTVRAQP